MTEPAAQLAAIDATVLERASRVIRVLGHPLRLRLLESLETGERNVTDLVLATGVSQAMVSQQLRILRAERVVDDRREGARVFYRITEPKVSRILDCIRECDLPKLIDPGDGATPDLRLLSPAGEGRGRGPGTARRDPR